MAGLLGNLLAGAAQGGAAAQQKTLFDEMNEQRRLSFAKIQQEYAQENAEFVDSLAGNREDAKYGKEIAYLSNDNSQAITNAEYAALPKEQQANYRRAEVATAEALANKDARENRKLDIQERKNELYEKKILGGEGGTSGKSPQEKYLEALKVFSKQYENDIDMTESEKRAAADMDARQVSGYMDGYNPATETEPEPAPKGIFASLKDSLFGSDAQSAEGEPKKDPVQEEMVTVSQNGKTFQVPRSSIQQHVAQPEKPAEQKQPEPKGILTDQPNRNLTPEQQAASDAAKAPVAPPQDATLANKAREVSLAKKAYEQAKPSIGKDRMGFKAHLDKKPLLDELNQKFMTGAISTEEYKAQVKQLIAS